MIYHSYIRTPAATQDRFRIGVDDTIIVPLVLIALLARTLYQVAFFIVSLASAFAFALLLRVMTLPLLVAATAGDGIAWMIRQFADLPSVSAAKR